MTLSLPLAEEQKTRGNEPERLRLVSAILAQCAFAIDNITGTDESIADIYAAARNFEEHAIILSTAEAATRKALRHVVGTFYMARETDGNFRILYEATGEPVSIAPDEWPIIWPVDSDVSARYEHPSGIILNAVEYDKIRELAPLEDVEAPTPEAAEDSEIEAADQHNTRYDPETTSPEACKKGDAQNRTAAQREQDERRKKHPILAKILDRVNDNIDAAEADE